MFYSQFILAKKGPLGTIWIAAHLERKLRKNQVAETNIGVSVDSILFPEVPIALRLSGHLLLGVVRIYSKKVNYLFHDCSEALVKIKQAFHSTIVDLPPEAATAPFHSITLPETFDFDELELLQDPESSFVQSNGNFVDHNVTTREQITLQDPMEDSVYPGSSQFGLDERFVDGDSSPIGLDFDEDIFTEKLGSPVAKPSSLALKEDVPPSTSGHGGNAVQMDIDHHELLTPVVDIDMNERNEPRGMSGLEQMRPDQQQNLSLLSPGLNNLDQSVMSRASSKDPDIFISGDGMPSLNVLLPHTQQVFEARTPDLNKEFCPPDEPSTPALPEETSLPFEQDLPPFSGSQERLFPNSSGGVERARPDEHIYMVTTNQISTASPLGQSKQNVVVPAQPTLQHFSPFCGSDQSSAAMDLQQVTLPPQPQLSNSLNPRNAALSSPDQSFTQNPVQQPSSAVNRNATATAFQGFNQPASMQQLPASPYCQSGQNLAVPAQFSLPMIDQHLSPFSGLEQSGAAMYTQQVGMPSQAELSSMLTSQNGSSSFCNQSFRLNPLEQASSVEANTDASFVPFQGFPLSPSVQQLPAGSYCQSRHDLCFPSQFSSSITEQHSTPFVGLQQSHAAIYTQQANKLSQQHFSMSISQKTPSFSDQSSGTNPVQKASLAELNRDTISAPFQGFPLPASLRQLMTGSYQNISLGTSNYLAPLAATNASHSMASLHQPFGRPSAALNQPWSLSIPNHEASSVFQQPGLLANPKTMLPVLMANSAASFNDIQASSIGTASVNHTLASSIGTAESSSVFQQRGTIWDQPTNMIYSINKIFQSTPIANNLPSSLTSSGSFSPSAQESSALAQTESTVLNTEIRKPPMNQESSAFQRSQDVVFTKENILSAAAQQQVARHETHQLAVTKETVSLAAAQHFDTSRSGSWACNLPSVSGIEKDQEQETLQGIQEPAVIPPYPVELHHVGSPAPSLPSNLPTVLEPEEGQRKTALNISDIPQRETLRSAAEALREEPEFLSIRNDLTSKKLAAQELDRNNAHAAKNNEKLKVVIPPLDDTPSWREETPITATKRSPFSTRSFDSVAGDDDVLATILGRDTSAFKVLPTPKENPVAKRPRVVLRSSFKKRKIEFDTLTVLHGDVIRLQLANTEDIRRVRKKAPCTRREIWSLNREIQGQQLFCEPSLPGLSTSLHDLYCTVFGVNGAKLPSADSFQTTQDSLVVESDPSRVVIEDRIGGSGRLNSEGLKENSSMDFPSETIYPPGTILLEESVACTRREDELISGVTKKSSNNTLRSDNLCLQSQHSEEVAVQIGSVPEQISVCETEHVHVVPSVIEAQDNALQNGFERVAEHCLQGSIFRGGAGNIDAVEQRAAEQVIIEKGVGQRFVDSVTCNLMDAGKNNVPEVEANREVQVITLQGEIAVESQGLMIHSEIEMQGPRTDGQCAQGFGAFGTDVLGSQFDLQSLQMTASKKEDVLSRQVDSQCLQATSNENQDVLSRQVGLQSSYESSNGKQVVLSRQVDIQSLHAAPNEHVDMQYLPATPNEQVDMQSFPAAPNEKQNVLTGQVDLQSLHVASNGKQDVLIGQVDLQSLPAAPNEKQNVISRQVDLQSSHIAPIEKQDVLSRQIDLQGPPYEKQDVLSREVDLRSLQMAPGVKHDILTREVNLQPLQKIPNVLSTEVMLQSLHAAQNENQDVVSRRVDLPTLEEPPNEKQDVLSREVDLQSLQITPGVKHDALTGVVNLQTPRNILSREVNMQPLQATSTVLSRVVDFQIASGVEHNVISKEVDLQPLQRTPNVHSREVNLQSLQATSNVLSRAVDFQPLQTTPNVLSREANLQCLQERPTVLSREVDLQTAPAVAHDVIRREANLQPLQTTPNVLSREVNLQSLQATPNLLSREVDFQPFPTTPNVLSREVNLQSLKATATVLNREVNFQTLQATPNILCGEVDLQSLQTTPNLLSREVNSHFLQTTPNVLSREIDLQSLQTTPNVFRKEVDLQPLQRTPNVLSREIGLQSLQATPSGRQDIVSMQVYLQSLQTTPGGKQDVPCRQVDLLSLPTTPSAEQEVVEVPSLSNSAMVVKGDDKEIIGDTVERRLDASKEDQDLAFISEAKATDFLAADDDMAYDEVNDFANRASDGLDSSIHDNNGWSVRTRNVGRYLKIVFEGMERNSKNSGEQGNPKLGLGRLLMGKTRKEAARMFFETLVLKTREYIHVEQKDAFEDIHLYPSPKLLKTSF